MAKRIRKKTLVALSVNLVVLAMVAVLFISEWNDPWMRAQVLVRTGNYQKHDEAYFTGYFGTPELAYLSNGGRTRNVCWPLDDSKTAPQFLTIVFNASGHAVDAMVHGW